MPKIPPFSTRDGSPVAVLAATYAALFFGFGVHLPFFPLWLADRGLGPAEVAILMATPLVSRVATLPLTTNAADRLGDLRLAIVAFALVSAAICATFLAFRSFWPLFLLTLVIGTFWGAIIPVLDALTTGLARRRGFDYGRVRLWGSFAFIAASVLIGALVDRTSIAVVVPVIAISLLGLVMIAARLPPPERTAQVEPPRLVEGWRKLLATPGFATMLAGAALVNASHGLLYVFGSIHWKAQGLSETWIGVLWAAGVVAEIAFFAASGPILARFGTRRLLIAGASLAVLRWAAMATDPGLALLLPLQVLHAASFAAVHVAMVNVLGGALDQRYAATSQGAYFALLGLTSGGSFLAAGPLYAAFGGQGQLAMAGLAAAGLALLLTSARSAQPHKAVDGG